MTSISHFNFQQKFAVSFVVDSLNDIWYPLTYGLGKVYKMKEMGMK